LILEKRLRELFQNWRMVLRLASRLSESTTKARVMDL